MSRTVKFAKSSGHPEAITLRDREILQSLGTFQRLSQDQIRRLFFSRNGALASQQAAWARLQRLCDRKLLERWRLPAAKGSGPFLYELSPTGKRIMGISSRLHARTRWSAEHDLGVAEFYVSLSEALRAEVGKLKDWMSPEQASFATTRGRLSPDAAFGWEKAGLEGSCFLEWDRGTQSLATFAEKLERYDEYYQLRRYRDHLGDPLKPRLLVVCGDGEREERVLGYVIAKSSRFAHLPTIFVSTRDKAVSAPLGSVWRTPSVADVALRFWEPSL